MDREGMSMIEKKDHKGFAKYLKLQKNTICGRHPIGVLLGAIIASSIEFNVNFIHYSQSEKATKATDSSVSYASAVITAQSTGA
jgi:AmmeMemoRadiSam system protein B